MKNYIPRIRFDALSDAVFAIAMTIMVLELKLPTGAKDLGSAELIKELGGLTPILIAYVASFVTLAQLWVSHSSLFKTSEEVPAAIAQLNLLFLFFVCLLPFPTALVGEYGLRVEVIVAYGIVQLGASTALGLLRLKVLNHQQQSRARLTLQRRRIMISSLTGIVGIGVALVFYGNEIAQILAYICIIAAPLAYKFVRS